MLGAVIENPQFVKEAAALLVAKAPEMLAQAGLPVTPRNIALMLTGFVIKPADRDDLQLRERWIAALMPHVENELARHR